MATLTATVNEITKAAGILNDRGRWITLQQCKALAEHEMYRNEETETTWMGYFRGVKTEGNIVFPEWG